MLPPVDLDALLNKKLASLTTGGYDVYSVPSCLILITTEALRKLSDSENLF
jgi:hypothetical protein